MCICGKLVLMGCIIAAINLISLCLYDVGPVKFPFVGYLFQVFCKSVIIWTVNFSTLIVLAAS